MEGARNLKLGILVLATLVAIIVAAVVLGIHAMAPQTVAYHAYFDESVQGLEIGAPVKYRGVRIGSVNSIDLARDRKHVDVVLAVAEHDVTRLDLERTAPHLRAQLGGQGLTGLKLVDIDLARPDEPPPQLPFAPARHVIPTRPSLLTGLASEFVALKRRLPELADRSTRSLDKLDRVLDDIHDSRLAARAGDAMDRLGSAAGDARRLVAHIDRARLPEHVTATLASTDQAIARADGVLRTVGELGRTTVTSSAELTRTMRDLGDAARAIQDFAEELERDPELLIKGRARSAER
jgi:phospholipid/cholesterol/gamma-HCH transport system substrate-binding protein